MINAPEKAPVQRASQERMVKKIGHGWTALIRDGQTMVNTDHFYAGPFLGLFLQLENSSNF
jgi:hypothetical protein